MKKTSTIMAIVLAIIVASCSTSYADSSWTTKGGSVASLYLLYLDKAGEYAYHKDHVAFKSLYDSDKIIILKKGISVYIVDQSEYKGIEYVKIRPKGQTVEIWTLRKAIE